MFSVEPEEERPHSRSDDLPNPPGSSVHNSITTSEATPLLGHTPIAREMIGSLTQQPPISNPHPCSTFTLRGLTIGIVLGTIVCIINIYFGLKTGRVTGFPLATAYIANNIARQFGPPLDGPENVFVVAVATAMAAMPMTAALVGVIPALEYLVGPEDGGPLQISLFHLLTWSAGVCVFGPILAMACSRYFLIFKDLPFPPGTATAILIKRFHAKKPTSRNTFTGSRFEERGDRGTDFSGMVTEPSESSPLVYQRETASWAFKVSIVVSGVWTLGGHLIPLATSRFGLTALESWPWNVQFSVGSVGQGVITGPKVAFYMLLGAIVRMILCSWISLKMNWQPDKNDDWDGFRGWIVWPSLAALLAHCLVNFVWACTERSILSVFWGTATSPCLDDTAFARHANAGSPNLTSSASSSIEDRPAWTERAIETRNPVYSGMSSKQIGLCFALATLLCIAFAKLSLAKSVTWIQLLLAVLLALPLSVVAIQAMGQTGMNPVSALGKVAQIAFGFIVARTSSNAIIVNLIAGAIAESGACQAADLLCDLKAGHLLGASPDGLLKGQLLGSLVGAFVASSSYAIFTWSYLPKAGTVTAPVDMPSAHMWFEAAKLCAGKGLPGEAVRVSIVMALVFAIIATVKIGFAEAWWGCLIPDGVSFALGLFNVWSLTVGWVIGGLVHWCWNRYYRGEEDVIILVASGLMLGEGGVELTSILLKMVWNLVFK
ncbi:hypothetical protein GJ744_001257 [Endocarpon pusillum]|uniref:Oligopeptide transporter n=1 Tax=Endocarpon pusillum TaxID=364733 RepID=A0A8H7ADK5_9EURO|nr:hypothetical protein GJ744_001257 [Endocarpon pusillum]